MKLTLGMIGGGPDSFIGAVHRKAAALDGHFDLVCGAFSSDPEKSKATGAALGLDPSRVYGSYDALFAAETQLDAVAIVTPNHVHFDPAKKALERGIHVILDKPMTFTLAEARELKSIVDRTGLTFVLTHTYAGYPMVVEARERVARGDIGTLRKVYVEYPQGWLSGFIENDGQKQASWRTDPSKSGAGGSVGDIGTHAAHLAEFVTGLRISHVNAMLNIVVPGRKLDDDASALLKFDNGATGVLVATQVAAGEENNLKLRVYGDKGGFEWSHTDPNTLLFKPLDAPTQILRTGNSYLSDAAKRYTRLPAGHPEGYIEAFANLYGDFAAIINLGRESGRMRGHITDVPVCVPSAADGVRGMAFIEAMVRSSQSDQKWTEVES